MTNIADDLSGLNFENVISHEIFKPKGGTEKVPPKFSTKCSDIQNPALSDIKTEIIKVMNRISVSIVFDPSNEQTKTPEILEDLFKILTDEKISDKEKEKIFIKNSKTLAEILTDKQDNRSPGGLFNLCFGHILNEPYILISKLEITEGLQITENPEEVTENPEEVTENPEEVTENLTLDIKRISNLIQIGRAKILKVALVWRKLETEGDTKEYLMVGRLCDTQSLQNGEVADYFLKKFLGFDYALDSRAETRYFYDTVYEYIKNNVKDPLTQSNMLIDLNSFLLKPNAYIVPKNFRDQYIPTEYKQGFDHYIINSPVEMNGFLRDTKYIQKKIDQSRIRFENGITLLAGTGDFGSNITRSVDENGYTHITIKSKELEIK